MQREDAIVAKAEADIAAGLGIDDDQVEAWLDALDRDPHTPLPSSRHGHSRR
jgi:predicted transcriptional regulator